MTTMTISLEHPGLVAAARAAGYRSRRLGPALFVLAAWSAAGGSKSTALEIIHAAIAKAEGRLS